MEYRNMRKIVLLIAIIMLTGCSENKNKNCIDNKKIIYVKYNQSIKGYDIKIKYIVLPNKNYSKWEDWLNGEMIIMSQKDTVLITDVRSNFQILSSEIDSLISYDLLSKEQTFFVNDYLLPLDFDDDVLYFERIDNNCNIAPFYFYDVNFDGKDELIKFNGGYGQRNRCLYSFYSFPEDTILDCGIEELEIDGAWRFDRKNKRIITDITCGAWCDIYEIWKWNDNKNEMIIIKMIEEIDCVDNQIETYHTIYKDEKEISSETVMLKLENKNENLFSEEFLYRGLD